MQSFVVLNNAEQESQLMLIMTAFFLGDTNRHTQAQFATVKWNTIYTECVGTFSYLTLQDPS